MPYFAPRDRTEALAFLADAQPRIVAGCTDYFPALPQGHMDENVLDITGLEGLRGISEADNGWRIGAATTWTDVVRASLPGAFVALQQAARAVGSVQIQNRATLAGNICNASPAADGVPPLLALNAEVEILSRAGVRTLPLEAFLTGVRRTALGPGELVSAIRVPPVDETARSAFVKLGSRTHLVISIAMVAAIVTVEGGRIVAARLAVGAASPVARRLPVLEAALLGATQADVGEMSFDAALQPLSPISDVRGTQAYRLDAVATLCRRAVLAAMAEG